MKATLPNGTILEGTPEELKAFGVGGAEPICNCIGHSIMGNVAWTCPIHGSQVHTSDVYVPSCWPANPCKTCSGAVWIAGPYTCPECHTEYTPPTVTFGDTGVIGGTTTFAISDSVTTRQ